MLLRKLYTLVFLRRDSEVLLGMKKRGFGVDKWNGFGGKVEPNESVVEAAARELKEECCVTVNPCDLKSVGHLEFTFEGNPLLAQTMMDVRVYTTSVFEGTPYETEEMKPRWYKCDDIPYDDMWPDDRIWFPYMLQGKLFHGKFHYKNFDTILCHQIVELDSMEEHFVEHKLD